MTSLDSAISLEPAQRWGGIPLVCWIVLLVVSLVTLSGPAIERTQEARVLVTAREMMDRPLAQWNVPTTNGAVRLRKPPLAYWMAAGSMKLFGPHEWAGRVPFALSAWATVGIVAMIGRRLFNQRTGFLAGLILGGTWLVARFTRLAETDTLTMFFVTLGVWAIVESIARPSMSTKIYWWTVLGIAGAGAALVKGPPAAYLLVIAIVLAIWLKQPQLFAGAGVLLVISIIPIGLWFLSIRHHPDFGQLEDDFTNSAKGGLGHKNGFYVYLWLIPQFMLPWSLLMILALVGGCVRMFRERQYSIELIVWSLAIFLPLCLWGNKQFQYLAPLFPPLVLMTAWWLDLWLSGRLCGGWVTWTRTLTTITTLGLATSAPRRRVVMLAWYGVLIIVAMAFWIGYWAPRHQKGDARAGAESIRKIVGDVPLVFRKEENLPLCFYLNTIVPIVPEKDFFEHLREHPEEVGLERAKPSNYAALPGGFSQVGQVPDDDQAFRLIRFSPTHP